MSLLRLRITSKGLSLFKLNFMAIFKRLILSVIFVYSYFLDLRATTAFKNLRSFNSKKEVQKTKIYPKITKHKSFRNFNIKINIVCYD